MLKVKTIGMINDNKKSFPIVKAHADIINGYFCTITDEATVAPTADTAKGADIYVVMNTINGDDSYTDAVVKAGENVNAFLVKQWDKQNLQLNVNHLTTAYGSVAKDDKLVIDATGKLVKQADVTGYAIYFRVVKKIQFAGNGLEVQIVVA